MEVLNHSSIAVGFIETRTGQLPVRVKPSGTFGDARIADINKSYKKDPRLSSERYSNLRAMLQSIWQLALRGPLDESNSLLMDAQIRHFPTQRAS